MNNLVRMTIAGLLLCAAPVAHATVVTWNLLDVRFGDNATATGFFTLDDHFAGFLTSFKITTSSGTLPGFVYEPASVSSTNVNSDGIELSVAGLLTGLDLFATSDLFNPDNTLVTSGTKALDIISVERLSGSTPRNVTSGSISAIPEPSSLAFLGLAGAVLVLLRKRSS